METRDQIEKICREFRIPGEMIRLEQMNNGNINATYRTAFENAGVRKEYTVQKINMYVFPYPKRIMSNIDLITGHIRQKLSEQGESMDKSMHFYHTAEGNNFVVDSQGFWRVYKYIQGVETYNETEDLHIIRETGRAFGRFQMQLADFDASQLFEIIPNFHNTRSRLAVFFKHVKEDPCGRVEEIGPQIERIRALRGEAVRLNELLDAEEIPLRVTHNDTKINNVLFDEKTGDARTVIDLDTVMPGLAMHDFGDGVRFCASTAAEDEADLTKVSLDLAKYRAFAEGFLGETGDVLEPMEIETMALGAFTMTVELAVRFFDDYITGDRYFRTAYPRHNLVRGYCQLHLAEDMLRKRAQMDAIVRELC